MVFSYMKYSWFGGPSLRLPTTPKRRNDDDDHDEEVQQQEEEDMLKKNSSNKRINNEDVMMMMMIGIEDTSSGQVEEGKGRQREQDPVCASTAKFGLCGTKISNADCGDGDVLTPTTTTMTSVVLGVNHGNITQRTFVGINSGSKPTTETSMLLGTPSTGISTTTTKGGITTMIKMTTKPSSSISPVKKINRYKSMSEMMMIRSRAYHPRRRRIAQRTTANLVTTTTSKSSHCSATMSAVANPSTTSKVAGMNPSSNNQQQQQYNDEQRIMMAGKNNVVDSTTTATTATMNNPLLLVPTTISSSSSSSRMPLPIPPPNKATTPTIMARRSKSITRLWSDTLPPQGVMPTLDDMSIDIIEYLCYLCLLESDYHGHLRYKRQLDDAIEQLGQRALTWTKSPSLSTPPELFQLLCRQRGRLHSRLQITALASDLATVESGGMKSTNDMLKLVNMATDAALHSSSQEERLSCSSSPSNTTTSKQWLRFRADLESLKGWLLRKDANLSSIDDAEDGNSSIIDTQLEEHEMMKEDYDEVIQLLHVQEVVATFIDALRSIEQQQQQKESKVNDGAGTNEASSSPVLLSTSMHRKLVLNAINQYEASLISIFVRDTSGGKTNKIIGGSTSGNRSHATSSSPRDDDGDLIIGWKEQLHIPKELRGFLLGDMYSPRRLSLSSQSTSTTTTSSSSSSFVPSQQQRDDGNSYGVGVRNGAGQVNNSCHNDDVHLRLLMHMEQTILNDDNRFSIHKVQQKTRALLIKWSESLLDVPTLVQLGYGGVVSPVVEKSCGNRSSSKTKNTLPPIEVLKTATSMLLEDHDDDDDDDVSSWCGSDDDDDDAEEDDQESTPMNEEEEGEAQQLLLQQPLGGISRQSFTAGDATTMMTTTTTIDPMNDEDKDIVHRLSLDDADDGSQSLHTQQQQQQEEDTTAAASESSAAVAVAAAAVNAQHELSCEKQESIPSTGIVSSVVAEIQGTGTSTDDSEDQVKEDCLMTQSIELLSEYAVQDDNEDEASVNHCNSKRNTKIGRQSGDKYSVSNEACETSSEATPSNISVSPEAEHNSCIVPSTNNGGCNGRSRRRPAQINYLMRMEYDSMQKDANIRNCRLKRKHIDVDEVCEIVESPEKKGKRAADDAMASRREANGERESLTRRTPRKKPAGNKNSACGNRTTLRYRLEELEAIREGVRRFGDKRWNAIQRNDPRLRNRTPTEVRQKYGSMLTSGKW